MSKYEVFQFLLDFVAAQFTVTDADMNTYGGAIEIEGKKDGQKIHITVELNEEEAKDD